jgi:hypothetical protein
MLKLQRLPLADPLADYVAFFPQVQNLQKGGNLQGPTNFGLNRLLDWREMVDLSG